MGKAMNNYISFHLYTTVNPTFSKELALLPNLGEGSHRHNANFTREAACVPPGRFGKTEHLQYPYKFAYNFWIGKLLLFTSGNIQFLPMLHINSDGNMHT